MRACLPPSLIIALFLQTEKDKGGSCILLGRGVARLFQTRELQGGVKGGVLTRTQKNSFSRISVQNIFGGPQIGDRLLTRVVVGRDQALHPFPASYTPALLHFENE